MSGSVLVVIETLRVSDREQFTAYQQQARQQVIDRGATLVARGAEAVEGPAPSGPLLIQRWQSAQAFRDWQESEEYRPLLELRRGAAEVRLTIVPEV